MEHARAVLTAEERAIVAEEERLLARAGASIAAAVAKAARAPRASELRSVDALRTLRDEAKAASEDDLPPLLLEMAVRQRLAERDDRAALPDPGAPYFAHLRVREGTIVKDYLLGRTSLLDTPAGVRIVDWRVAPVARIFYRYVEGDAYEESFPGREAEGVVEARRVVVIERGELVRVVGDDVVLERSPGGEWSRLDRADLSLTAGGAGSAVRPGASAEITALLDREQFAAISAPADQALVVLGSAGSGKTTVALHRLARLAAEAPRDRVSRVAVVVPEEGLARLSRRLLAPLGAAETQVQTLDAWAHALARQVFGEPMPKVWLDAPGLVTSLKRHPALHDAMRARFAKVSAKGTSLPRLRRRLADAFTDRVFLESVVAASRGDLPRSAIEETVRHTMLQLAEPLARQLSSITDAERKRALDGRPIDQGTPEELAGSIDVEDLPILLFLRAWRAGIEVPPLTHLVVDEAEDFSLFELFVLGKQLASPPSVTLAGDEMQQTSSSFAGWDRATTTLGTSAAVTCRLEVSYRCPRPVVLAARHVLGHLAADSAMKTARDGAPVGKYAFPEEGHALLFLATALRDLASRDPHASIGVLAHDAEAARSIFAIVREVPEARLVLDGAFGFEPGIDVTDVDSAKGLEFDYVIVPDATARAYPPTDDARRRLHVAVTRASHQLWLVAGGRPSPILEGLEASPGRSSVAPATDQSLPL
jgi:DNA helicase II / ATP-dependent DNA helicase PcrA